MIVEIDWTFESQRRLDLYRARAQRDHWQAEVYRLEKGDPLRGVSTANEERRE